MMILESFEIHGYTAQLMDDYSIRITNPAGKQVKNPTKEIRADTKWKRFLQLRSSHDKDISTAKTQITKIMNSGNFLTLEGFYKKQFGNTEFTMADMENITKGMYVEGT